MSDDVLDVGFENRTNQVSHAELDVGTTAYHLITDIESSHDDTTLDHFYDDAHASYKAVV